MTGAAIGSGLDDVDARNRQIAATLGRQVPPGTVSLPDVIAMSKAGVNEELIVNHIRANGLARPMQSGDLIALQQNGVSTRVISAANGAAAGRLHRSGPCRRRWSARPIRIPTMDRMGRMVRIGAAAVLLLSPAPVVGWGVSVGGPL